MLENDALMYVYVTAVIHQTVVAFILNTSRKEMKVFSPYAIVSSGNTYTEMSVTPGPHRFSWKSGFRKVFSLKNHAKLTCKTLNLTKFISIKKKFLCSLNQSCDH